MTHTRTHRRKGVRRTHRLRKGGDVEPNRAARAAMMGYTPKTAVTVSDAVLPVTGETSTEVPKASVYQVAEKAAEAAADKAQDAEFVEAARAKERAPLEAKRKAVETRLKALQTRMDDRRDTRGRASGIQLDLKANLQDQLREIDEQLHAIGGRRKTRRRKGVRKTRKARRGGDMERPRSGSVLEVAKSKLDTEKNKALVEAANKIDYQYTPRSEVSVLNPAFARLAKDRREAGEGPIVTMSREQRATLGKEGLAKKYGLDPGQVAPLDEKPALEKYLPKSSTTGTSRRRRPTRSTRRR
jgi:hypothetical protein